MMSCKSGFGTLAPDSMLLLQLFAVVSVVKSHISAAAVVLWEKGKVF